MRRDEQLTASTNGGTTFETASATDGSGRTMTTDKFASRQRGATKNGGLGSDPVHSDWRSVIEGDGAANGTGHAASDSHLFPERGGMPTSSGATCKASQRSGDGP